MKPHSAFVQSKQKIMFSIFCGKCELCLNKLSSLQSGYSVLCGCRDVVLRLLGCSKCLLGGYSPSITNKNNSQMFSKLYLASPAHPGLFLFDRESDKKLFL